MDANTKPTAPTAQSILLSLDSAEIIGELRKLEAQEKALKVLLRAAKCKERGTPSKEAQHA